MLNTLEYFKDMGKDKIKEIPFEIALLAQTGIDPKNMMDDILKGKREYAHFQLTRNADGIKELFSDKVFLANNQNKEKYQ